MAAVTTAQAHTVACPACMARRGEACTQPTDTARRPVRWVHLAREDAYLGAQDTR